MKSWKKKLLLRFIRDSRSRCSVVIPFTHPVVLFIIRSFVRGFNCSYLISFVPSLILPFCPSFTDTFFLFFRFFIRSWSYFVISLVRSFVFFLLHLSPTSLLLHSFIYSHIQFPNYLLQFAAILDACSSAVVVWRFSGIAGQKYSFERERK